VAAASYLACIAAARLAGRGHLPAILSAALPGGAGLPGGHDLRLHRALRAVHLLPVHSGGINCAGGWNPQDARHGGTDAAADFEVHLAEINISTKKKTKNDCKNSLLGAALCLIPFVLSNPAPCSPRQSSIPFFGKGAIRRNPPDTTMALL